MMAKVCRKKRGRDNGVPPQDRARSGGPCDADDPCPAGRGPPGPAAPYRPPAPPLSPGSIPVLLPLSDPAGAGLLRFPARGDLDARGNAAGQPVRADAAPAVRRDLAGHRRGLGGDLRRRTGRQRHRKLLRSFLLQRTDTPSTLRHLEETVPGGPADLLRADRHTVRPRAAGPVRGSALGQGARRPGRHRAGRVDPAAGARPEAEHLGPAPHGPLAGASPFGAGTATALARARGLFIRGGGDRGAPPRTARLGQRRLRATRRTSRARATAAGAAVADAGHLPRRRLGLAAAALLRAGRADPGSGLPAVHRGAAGLDPALRVVLPGQAPGLASAGADRHLRGLLPLLRLGPLLPDTATWRGAAPGRHGAVRSAAGRARLGGAATPNRGRWWW